MNKVLADGSLGISESDRFITPAGVTVNLNCSGGGEDEATKQEDAEGYYFD